MPQRAEVGVAAAAAAAGEQRTDGEPGAREGVRQGQRPAAHDGGHQCENGVQDRPAALALDHRRRLLQLLRDVGVRLRELPRKQRAPHCVGAVVSHGGAGADFTRPDWANGQSQTRKQTLFCLRPLRPLCARSGGQRRDAAALAKSSPHHKRVSVKYHGYVHSGTMVAMLNKKTSAPHTVVLYGVTCRGAAVKPVTPLIDRPTASKIHNNNRFRFPRPARVCLHRVHVYQWY
jgi:hypothetical protein